MKTPPARSGPAARLDFRRIDRTTAPAPAPVPAAATARPRSNPRPMGHPPWRHSASAAPDRPAAGSSRAATLCSPRALQRGLGQVVLVLLDVLHDLLDLCLRVLDGRIVGRGVGGVG